MNSIEDSKISKLSKMTSVIYLLITTLFCLVCGWVLSGLHETMVKYYHKIYEDPLSIIPYYAIRLHHWPYWFAVISFLGCITAMFIPRYRYLLTILAFAIMTAGSCLLLLHLVGYTAVCSYHMSWK